MIKQKKINRGITLIALVVTIVVLLIIAAVSIGVLTGENSIINQSKQAKDDTEIAEEKETIELSAAQAAGKDAYGNIKEENLREQLNNNIGEGKYNLEIDGDKFKITYIESNRSYYVDEYGGVEVAEKIDGDNILDELIKDPDKFYEEAQDKGQENKQDIGIDSNGNVVNLDLWAYYKTDDGNGMSLGATITCAPYVGYIGDIVNGKIIGEIPQYIYLSEEKKIYEVVKLESTFYGINDIIEIPKIPSSVTSIGQHVFERCESLTNITIPDSVTSIKFSAFHKCSSLTSIIIPSSVTSIGNSAFYNCTSLTTVNYTGTQEEWNKISIGSGNTYLTNATINYNYKGE